MRESVSRTKTYPAMQFMEYQCRRRVLYSSATYVCDSYLRTFSLSPMGLNVFSPAGAIGVPKTSCDFGFQDIGVPSSLSLTEFSLRVLMPVSLWDYSQIYCCTSGAKCMCCNVAPKPSASSAVQADSSSVTLSKGKKRIIPLI